MAGRQDGVKPGHVFERKEPGSFRVDQPSAD